MFIGAGEGGKEVGEGGREGRREWMVRKGSSEIKQLINLLGLATLKKEARQTTG